MRWMPYCGLVLLLAAGPNVTTAEDDPVALRDLDDLVARWIGLRGTLAEETRTWDKRRAQWEEEIRLLEQEAAALEKELDETRDSVSSTEEERAEAIARRERTQSELSDLDNVLDGGWSRIKDWGPYVPDSLRGSLPRNVQSAAQMDTAMEDAPRTRQAQTIVAMLSALEALQNRFHVTRETIAIDGSRRQVDVLYIGLARAFAVSPAGDWAGVGVPTKAGWQWSANGADPRQVRQVIDVYNRQQTAALALLPLSVDAEGQP